MSDKIQEALNDLSELTTVENDMNCGVWEKSEYECGTTGEKVYRANLVVSELKKYQEAVKTLQDEFGQ